MTGTTEQILHLEVLQRALEKAGYGTSLEHDPDSDTAWIRLWLPDKPLLRATISVTQKHEEWVFQWVHAYSSTVIGPVNNPEFVLGEVATRLGSAELQPPIVTPHAVEGVP